MADAEQSADPPSADPPDVAPAPSNGSNGATRTPSAPPATYGRPRSPITHFGRDGKPIAATPPAAPRSGPRVDPSRQPASTRPASWLPDLGAPKSARTGPGSELSGPESREPQRPPGLYLSPRMTAIFGGLFGLACITSIVALLIQVAPPRDERAAASAAPTAAASAAAPRTAAEVGAAKKRQRTSIPGPWRLEELAKDPSLTIVTGQLEKKSFVELLADKDVPKAQTYRIMKAFDGIRKFDKGGKKDRVSVALEKGTRKVRAFEYEVSPLEVYQAREGADGLLTGTRLDMKVAEEQIAGAFYVGKDVSSSVTAAGLEDGILAALDEALAGHASSETYEEGAIVRFVVVEQTALGEFAAYKQVVAVEYKPADPSAKPIRVYRYDGDSHGWFDERAKSPFGGGWRFPIPGAPVTSNFNPKRMHPILHKIMPHEGTDIGAPVGTPVYSAFRGTVSWVGLKGATGNLVLLDHAGGIETGYAHLSKYAAGLKIGDKVGTHQLVGYVGSTGRSTGPHLHFSAKKDGKFFDAMTLHLDGERVLPPSERPAFMGVKADLDRRLEAIAMPEPPPEAPKEVAAAMAAVTNVGAQPPAPAMPGLGVVPVNGTAAAAAASSEGIHPGSMVEDDSDDDGEGVPIAAPQLGPGAPAPAPKAPAKEDEKE